MKKTILRNWEEGTPMIYDFNINLKTLIDLCRPSGGVSALWIESIEIMESYENIENKKVDLKTNVKIGQRYGEPTITITLGDVLKAITKICQGGVVRKDLEERIFKSYWRDTHHELDSETDDCILQVATFGEIFYV